MKLNLRCHRPLLLMLGLPRLSTSPKLETVRKSLLALLIVLTLFTAASVAPAALIGIEARELKLVQGTGRVWPFGEGWLLRMSAPGEVQTGDFALPQQLAPGKYQLFIRARNGGAKVKISCGATTVNSVAFPGDWSSSIPLEIKAPTNSITLLVSNTQPSAVNFILQSLALTDQQGVTIYGDYLVKPPGPVAADTSPAIPGNLIPNSGFEVGLGRGWMLATPKERRDFATAAIVDQSAAHQGRASVKIPPGSTLTSRVFRLRPWRKHAFSLWAKSEAPQANLVLEIFNVHQDKAEAGFAAQLKQTFPLEPKKAWQRLVLGDRLSGFPAPEYQLRISSKSEHSIWIDDLQLEEGGASNYRPMTPLEIGLVSDKGANLFQDHEPVQMKLLACNSQAQPVSATAQYEIYDYLNRKLKEGEVALAVAAYSRWEKNLDLATGKRGIFRVMLWLKGVNGSDEEVVYSVLPRPQHDGPDPSSLIGVHGIASDFQCDVLQRMGMKWQRIMSPELWFRWSHLEPQPGLFVWHDAEAQKMGQHGFVMLGNLTTEPWPKWAAKDDLKAWEQAVFKTVEHYKSWVHYWEVCNEPIYQHTPAKYAQMLQTASRAIRRADPAAKIVGIGGSYDCNWCLEAIKHLGGNPFDFMDYFSTHVYPEKADPLNPLKEAAQKVFLRKIIGPYKIEVWNTETGVWSQGIYQGIDAGFRAAGEPLSPSREAWRFYRGNNYEAAMVARNFLHSIGNGFTRYFYYDSRFPAAAYARNQSHCTLFDLGDTIKAEGIAYAIDAKFFDHAKGLGDISPNRNTFAYLFDRQGTALAGIFAADKENMTRRKTITLGLAGRVKGYDMMGNEVPIEHSQVAYGRQPIYLEGESGLTVGQLTGAITNGVISELEDNTAPNISISDAPRGTIPLTSARLRWIAIDETAIPIAGSPANAIQYSHRLVGWDNQWSAWTANTRVDYEKLPPGDYRFEVKARDLCGNVSAIALREFTVQSR